MPATMLVGNRPELFGEVDRLRAEGDFRLAVSLPLLVLVVAIGISMSHWWLLLIPAPFVLFAMGVRRRIDSRDVIWNALQMGVVDSPSDRRFQLFVKDLVDGMDDFRAADPAAGPPAR